MSSWQALLGEELNCVFCRGTSRRHFDSLLKTLHLCSTRRRNTNLQDDHSNYVAGGRCQRSVSNGACAVRKPWRKKASRNSEMCSRRCSSSNRAPRTCVHRGGLMHVQAHESGGCYGARRARVRSLFCEAFGEFTFESSQACFQAIVTWQGDTHHDRRDEARLCRCTNVGSRCAEDRCTSFLHDVCVRQQLVVFNQRIKKTLSL